MYTYNTTYSAICTFPSTHHRDVEKVITTQRNSSVNDSINREMEGASTSTNTSTSTDGNIDPEALKEIAKFELFAIDFKLRQQGRAQ